MGCPSPRCCTLLVIETRDDETEVDTFGFLARCVKSDRLLDMLASKLSGVAYSYDSAVDERETNSVRTAQAAS